MNMRDFANVSLLIRLGVRRTVLKTIKTRLPQNPITINVLSSPLSHARIGHGTSTVVYNTYLAPSVNLCRLVALNPSFPSQLSRHVFPTASNRSLSFPGRVTREKLHFRPAGLSTFSFRSLFYYGTFTLQQSAASRRHRSTRSSRYRKLPFPCQGRTQGGSFEA